MEPKEKATDMFLKDIKQDVFEQPLTEEVKKEETAETLPSEQDETKLRNRRERRLAEKLQAERESNIQLTTRLQTLAEANRLTKEESEALKALDALWGADTPEAKLATSILKKSLMDIKEEAKREAIDSFKELREQDAARLAKEEEKLDSIVEELEEEHNVSLTLEQQKGFFRLMEKLSPKDKNGDIVEYADPEAVWEIYQGTLRKPDTRAREVSSRSMTASGASKETKLEDDSTLRFLKENNII